jgi:hypothetical protein
MHSRNRLKAVMSILCLAVGLAAVGCYVRAVAPGYGAEFEVEGPPPAIQEEAVVASPGPDYVWVGGYWDWDVGVRHWAWRSGRWERPPHPEAHWSAGHYELRGGHHYYHPGHWDRGEHHDRDRDHG